ncbi:MAG: nuclear transport factor 2 family protein [Mucilaginibacter sp.]
MFKTFILLAGLFMLISGGAIAQNTIQRYQPEPYVPESPELYRTIAHMDSVFFNAYNTCNMDIMASIFADSLEFYHDKGGLSTSKAQVLEATKKNICGKVTRELIPGSIEVYTINNFGAVEIGYHRFHNNTEPAGTLSSISKFITIWQFKNGDWKISRVVSLH